MTTVQKQHVLTGLTSLVIPILAAVFAAGAARQQLVAMESTSAHTSDIRDVRDEIHDVKSDIRVQQIRDSAQMAAMLSRITDVACVQNPNRRYCR